MAANNYDGNGVLLSKKTIYAGDKVKLTYTGLLANSGAQEVFVHIGFGPEWDNKALIPMSHEGEAFTAEIEIASAKTMGVCFKDGGDNWDNNSGENYNFKITKKAAPAKPKTAKKEITAKASKATKKVKKA
jgi:hypothetical protein